MRTRRLVLLGLGCLAGAAAAQQPAPGRAVRMLPPPSAAGALGAELTGSTEGVLLSWLEPVAGVRRPGHALRFSRLAADGWTEPGTVCAKLPFFVNWADFPSVVARADGALLAHWLERSGEQRYAYDVQLALSEDHGETWHRLGTPHRDRTRTEHGFVSVVADGVGFRVVWLDGREMAAADGPRRMALRSRLVDGAAHASEVLDPDVCTCCQTAAVRAGGAVVVAYRDHAADEVRDIAIVRRDERGWSEPATLHPDGWRIAGCPVNGPALAADGQRVVAAWFSGADGVAVVRVAFSEDAGVTFGKPIDVDAAGPLGRVDVACVPGGAAVLWLAAGTEEQAAVRLCRIDASGTLGATLDVGTTGTARSSGFPRLARDGARLVAVWRGTAAPAGLRAASVPIAGL